MVSRRGSGTFVAQTAPESSLTANGKRENSSIATSTAHLSRRGQHLLGQVSASPRQWGAFIPGVPDVNAFPHPLFSKIQARISRRPKPERLSYSCNGGTPELQQALVDYLRVSRGVHCQADQILITEGSTRRLTGHSHAVRQRRSGVGGGAFLLGHSPCAGDERRPGGPHHRRCQWAVPAGNG